MYHHIDEKHNATPELTSTLFDHSLFNSPRAIIIIIITTITIPDFAQLTLILEFLSFSLCAPHQVAMTSDGEHFFH